MGLIQIRDLHRTLKARAAARGASLTRYTLSQATQAAHTPRPEELDDRIRQRGPAGVRTEDILAARDRRA